MKTLSINAYQFSELSDKAKEKAAQYHTDLFCTQEFWETAQAISEVFPVNIESIDGTGYHNEYTIEDGEVYKTKAEYLAQAKYPNEPNCPLTGCYSDESFIDSLPENVPLTKEDFEYSVSKFFRAYQEECENEQSNEFLGEHFNANDILFFEDGTIVRI